MNLRLIIITIMLLCLARPLAPTDMATNSGPFARVTYAEP